MLWQVWRIAALGVAVLALGLMIGSTLSQPATPGFRATLATPGQVSSFRVTSVAPQRDVHPDVRVGDVLSLRDPGAGERLRYARQRPGDTFVFDRERGSPVTVRLNRVPERPVSYVYLAIAFAFLAVGTLLAVRRPQMREVRALSGLLLLFSVALCASPQSWMPVGLVGPMLLLGNFAQFAALGFAVHLATVFPDPAAGGSLARIRYLNIGVVIGLIAVAMFIAGSVYLRGVMPPAVVMTIGHYPWVYYVVAISTAFWIANRRSSPGDRTRVRWVSLSLAVGFCGVIVNLVLLIVAHVQADWMVYLPLTMIAVPLGLGYAIVRHRVVDIGFVLNRALVFGTVSAIVVVAFMVLEWILGSILVKVSHVTSTSLELGLALVLGFSLRSIHGRVHAAVDDIFFRARHDAERALRTLAREIAYVTAPRVAIARVHAELVARTGAPGAAVYIADAAGALRVDPAETPAPDHVDIDDPALVRMRATRAPLALRDVRSALRGDRAFPMLVREALTGVVVLE
ncbi:MAG: hypothetical protein QOJ39_1970, partial [Candidatus Eremiobacteraeota bacterium]|nr:hypothetical protein [Candidatus Eremiobacteraeota bacterium]